MGGPFRNYCVEKSKKGNVVISLIHGSPMLTQAINTTLSMIYCTMSYGTAVTSFVTGVFSRR